MTTAHRLADDQLTFFQTFGYLILPGLLSDRIGGVIDEFERMWREMRGHNGSDHNGSARSCCPQFLDRSDQLSTLLDDPRVEGAATSLLGDDFNYMGSDGNLYAGDTGWHSDGWSANHLHVKFAFYLDPVGRHNGGLRVIPGSHRIGDAFAESCQRALSDPKKHLGMDGRDVPCLALETTPGDVV